MGQGAAFATGVPPDIYAFHHYTGNSAPSPILKSASFTRPSPVEPGISRGDLAGRLRALTPNKSGQRSPPTYYRGCWHVVSRGLFGRYRHHLPAQKGFTRRNASSPTRRCSIRPYGPLWKIPRCCLPWESGPCLSPSVADHPLRPATRHSLGAPLPHLLADGPRAPHPAPFGFARAIHRSPGRMRY